MSLVFVLLHILSLSVWCIRGLSLNWKRLKSEPLRYLKHDEPFVITNSPLTIWTLLDHLPSSSNVQGIRDGNKFILSLLRGFEDFPFEVRERRANCFCLKQLTEKDVCDHFASTFLYEGGTAYSEHILSFWTEHESCSSNQHYADCIEDERLGTSFSEFLQSLLVERQHDANDHGDDTVIKRRYLSLDIAERNGRTKELMLAPSFKKLMHLVFMEPFYDLFGIKYPESVFSMHLWMGSNRSTSVRHYDAYHNLYFVLRGKKQFLLSRPSISSFPLYPYSHPSRRHECRAFAVDADAEAESEYDDKS